MASEKTLNVLVLAGGPDREREVSLAGGKEVAEALRQAGHHVTERDILPDDLSALDEFQKAGGDVIFPVLHGRWGEGGGLQRVLSDRNLSYVGCGPGAASMCMNKHLTKLTVAEHGIKTPEAQLLLTDTKRTVKAPVVIKAIDEGSTLGLSICHSEQEADAAQAELIKDYPKLLAERYIKGKELTVGVIAGENDGPTALPTIQIVPAVSCYDYDAKYQRDDTQYLFEIDLPEATLVQVRAWSVKAFEVLGVRHLCRVDFMVDEQCRPWLIEVNTLPGFTTHSLLPMAARRAGLDLPALTDRLVRLAAGGPT